MRCVVICVFLGVFISARAQPSLADSIATDFQKRPSLSLRLDMRNAFITNQLVQIGGVKMGLNYGRKINVGLSWNWLRTRVYHIPAGTGEPERLSLQYASAYFEYTFYDKNRWLLSMPVMMGFGTWRYKSMSGNARTGARFITVFEATENIGYSISPWLSVDAGIGYRVFPITLNYSAGQLHSPIYALRLKLKVGQLLNL